MKQLNATNSFIRSSIEQSLLNNDAQILSRSVLDSCRDCAIALTSFIAASELAN